MIHFWIGQISIYKDFTKKLPWQGEQSAAPSPDFVPSGQSVQEDASSSDFVPARQKSQKLTREDNFQIFIEF